MGTHLSFFFDCAFECFHVAAKIIETRLVKTMLLVIKVQSSFSIVDKVQLKMMTHDDN